ncbi:unnamed protein product [Vitrella brassicaformis CCMP3155]|uniref:SET domain-containing protein n=3 Tax=Vitrella brassicaformis TaxID=1169539 RepID=A0A0G4EM14_VITBC|nr:unnamed protein product [Vitrella brassicaformis CCMP3155]|eukprot:CEL98470.1 unnamed protein product [Vitrella brassicaformis CCMP3155]
MTRGRAAGQRSAAERSFFFGLLRPDIEAEVRALPEANQALAVESMKSSIIQRTTMAATSKSTRRAGPMDPGNITVEQCRAAMNYANKSAAPMERTLSADFHPCVGGLLNSFSKWGTHSADEIIAHQHAFLLQKFMIKTQGLHEFGMTDASVRSRVTYGSATSFAGLERIRVREMLLWQSHPGRVLVVNIVTRPLKQTCVGFIGKDEEGTPILVAMYNCGMYSQEDADEKIKPDTWCAIANPFYKIAGDGFRAVRIDDPSQVRLDVSPRDASFQAEANKVRAADPSTAEGWKAKGNSHFGKREFLDAYIAYMKGIRLGVHQVVCEVLMRRAKCRIGCGEYLGAFMDVFTVLRLLPHPTSVEKDSKVHVIQQAALDIYGVMMQWLTASQGDTSTSTSSNGNSGIEVPIPTRETMTAFVTDVVTHLCTARGPEGVEGRDISEALQAGEVLQDDDENYAEAADVFTAGLAEADLDTLMILLSNASACLLKPELVKEGGPDAMCCAAAALHISCLKPCAEFTPIQQKVLVRLGQALLAERLFDAADVVVETLGQQDLTEPIKGQVDALSDRLTAHKAQAKGDFDWPSIYACHLANAKARQDGKPPTPLDLAEYAGPITVKQAEGKGRGLFATRNIQPGELLIVQKPLILETGAAVFEIEGNRLTRGSQHRAYEKLVKLAVDGWHPRLVSQLGCLSEGPDHLPTYEAPSVDRTMGLGPTAFPFLPRLYMGALKGGKGDLREFGAPFVQLHPDQVRNLCDNNIHDAHGILARTPKKPRSEGDKNGWDNKSGLWVLPSLMNHDGTCRNAMWVAIDEWMVVRATRPIAEGAEVLTAYYPCFGEIPPKKEADFAKKWSIPSAYDNDTYKALEDGEKRFKVIDSMFNTSIEPSGRPAKDAATKITTGLLECDKLQIKIEDLNVPTLLISRVHKLRGMLLSRLLSWDEVARCFMQSIEASRAIRGPHEDDLATMANFTMFVKSGPAHKRMVTEMKKTCEVLYGTSEAANVLFLGECDLPPFRT